jgi:hypothetical protein
VREAITLPRKDTATGRALVDLLMSDTGLSAAARETIAAFSERSLTPGDLAGLVAYRTQKLVDESGQEGVTYSQLATAWHNLSVFAVQVVQAQTANNGAAGAEITVTFGGFQPPAPPAGRVPRRTDATIGDIVDTE